MTNPLEVAGDSGAMLHVLQGALQGQAVRLQAPEMRLGREDGDLDLGQYVQMSRQHSRLFLENGTWNIQDLGSTNGTLVNGERVISRRLQDGDVLQMGNFTARVSLPHQQRSVPRPDMTQLAPPLATTPPPTQRLPQQSLPQPGNPWPSQPAPQFPAPPPPPPVQYPAQPYPPMPGYQVNNSAPFTPPKSAGLAAILSFLFCGLGQLYNGEIGKSVAFLAAGIFGGLLICILIGWIILPVIWIVGIIDAYQSAERINAQARAQAQSFYHPPRY